ncbi:helix-turn-helix domain-containing protein [Microtetraspora malaysiensis]|uniref:helix-turn-helix domain-containing protein n=1 Tax=Microtetraspora malaysiensis TaxID=161358 RepID=UPI003D90CCD5
MNAHDSVWRSPQARTLITARNIGGLIKYARQIRGWRQADLGQHVGYSASTISRLEASKRASTDMAILHHVMSALDVPVEVLGELLGITTVRIGTTAAQPIEDDPMRRRTFLAGIVPLGLLASLEDALVLLPSPARSAHSREIAARLTHSRHQFDMGAMSRLVADLPDLLAVAHEATDREGTPASTARLAACYDLAAEALNKVGATRASRVTADRAMLYARHSGSPIAHAAAARSLGIVLRHDGRHRVADQLASDALAILEATGLKTRAQSATYAQILCTSAYTAAQAGDRDRALEMIREAQRATVTLPDYPVPGQPFTVTPAHVTLYQVGVHWSLGDAGAALHAGRDLRAAQFSTPERRGRLHTDLARAWWQWRKPEQTASALLAAHGHAPSEVRDRPAIRQIAVELAERHPRVAGVPELAAAIGYRRASPR